ncbi:UNVERIFIED_CONTAM: hypothetical protein Sradi_2343800 [Sesamum radiatum]|uniref:Uncharacterized protein n=1 Tax=Sesamum radiatum TaxID=300843 RepID=A0AAW2T6I8_SESRA
MNNQNRDEREDVHVTDEHDEGKNVEADGASGFREKESSMQSEEERANSEERSAENGRTDVDQSDQSSETAKTKNLGDDQEEESEVDLNESKELATVGDADSRRTSKPDIGDVNGELAVREGGVKLELQENSRGRQFTLRGKHGELRRAKGKRKYGSSTTGAIKDIGNNFEKGQPRNGDKVRDESVLKTNVKDYMEENNGGDGEESRSGIKLQNRIKPVGAEYMISGKFAKFDMSNQVEDEREVMTEHSENKNNVKRDNTCVGREDDETNDDRHDDNQIDQVETEVGMESAQHWGEDGEADKDESDF